MTYLERQNQKPDLTPTIPTSAAITGVSNNGKEQIKQAQKDHPEWYSNSFSDAWNTFKNNVETMDNPNNDGELFDPPKPGSPRSSGGSKGHSSAKSALQYLYADLAQYYGMNSATAYQEALSNTAYQRSVMDMRNAGLNPSVLFGTGHGQSANSSIYASAAAAGGGGGGRSYGGSGNGKLFSGSMYSAISTIGGLVGAVVTKNAGGFWIGSQTAKGAMGLADAISKLKKKW